MKAILPSELVMLAAVPEAEVIGVVHDALVEMVVGPSAAAGAAVAVF